MSHGLNLYNDQGVLTASTDFITKGLLYGGNALVNSTNTISTYGLGDRVHSNTRTGLLVSTSYADTSTAQNPWFLNITTGGRVASNGVFYPPSSYSTTYNPGNVGSNNWNGGNSSVGDLCKITTTSQPVLCSTFGASSPSAEIDYGFRCTNANGTSVLFSNSYVTMNFITPVINATATHLPLNSTKLATPSGGPQNITQGITMNVSFPYPLDLPPLIFITNSSGPVSLGHLFTDSNGKYIGASVVSFRTFNSWVSSGGTTYQGWIDPAPCTFSYFLAYGTTPASQNSGYGLEIYNSSGQVVMTTNKNFGMFDRKFVNTPYTRTSLYSSANRTVDTDINANTFYWESEYSDGLPRAFCLNDFRAVEGVTRIVGEAAYITASSGILVASMNYHGNFLEVNQSSKYAYTTSRGSTTLGAMYFRFANTGYAYLPSHEFSDLSLFGTIPLISTNY